MDTRERVSEHRIEDLEKKKVNKMKNLILSDKTYNLLKWVALILLPALGTLYFALASIWGLPFGEQIVGTITAIDTF